LDYHSSRQNIVQLTHPEKLILTMLADLHEKLGVGTTDTKLIKAAIHTDNTWALTWELHGIIGDGGEPTPAEVTEVVNILDMWSVIEEADERLATPQMDAIEPGTGAIGAPDFPGFDGNHESRHFSIAMFLVKDMDRFSRFKGRDLNSHRHCLDGYRRMLKIWETIRPDLVDRPMSSTEMVNLLSARDAA
jgi:uncharacterized protein YfbU (UPF0304 family)